MCNANGQKIKFFTNYNENSFKIAYIMHFQTKTAEEFAWKLEKGHADVVKRKYQKRKDNKIGLFFYVNILTPEKLNLLRKYLTYKDRYRSYFTKLYSDVGGIDYVKEGRHFCEFLREKKKTLHWV